MLDLETNFGYKLPQQDLRKVIKVLVDEKCLLPINNRPIRYKINHQKFKILISDGDIFKYYQEFIPEIKNWALT